MTYPHIDVMRRDISKMYSSDAWKQRVKHMPDNQVFAIWNKFCEEGRFKNEPEVRTSRTCESITPSRKTIHTPEEIKRADPVVANDDYHCEQLALDI